MRTPRPHSSSTKSSVSCARAWMAWSSCTNCATTSNWIYPSRWHPSNRVACTNTSSSTRRTSSRCSNYPSRISVLWRTSATKTWSSWRCNSPPPSTKSCATWTWVMQRRTNSTTNVMSWCWRVARRSLTRNWLRPSGRSVGSSWVCWLAARRRPKPCWLSSCYPRWDPRTAIGWTCTWSWRGNTTPSRFRCGIGASVNSPPTPTVHCMIA